MSHPIEADSKMQLSPLVSAQELYGDGPFKENLMSCAKESESGITISQESRKAFANAEKCEKRKLSDEMLSTFELALDHKDHILKHSSKRLKTNLGKASKSYKTSEVASTSGVLGLTRFWQQSLVERYKECILPTRTDFVGSHTISSKHFSSSTVQKSKWQTMTINKPLKPNLQKTSFQSSQFLERVCMDNEVQAQGKGLRKRKTPLEGKLRTMRVRLHFATPLQRGYMKEWIWSAQKVYNSCVERMQDMEVIDEGKLRREFLTDMVLEEWEKDVPRRVRDASVKEAVKNERLCRKAGGKLAFKDSRKMLSQTIELESTGTMGPIRSVQACEKGLALAISPRTRLGKEGSLYIKHERRLAPLLLQDNGLKFGGKITWNRRIGCFYLCVAYEKGRRSEPDPTFSSKRVVSLDPGIKTVQTFYSPDGTHGSFLDGYEVYVNEKIDMIKKIRKRIEEIKECKRLNCASRGNAIRKAHLREAFLRWKLACWMDNQHYFMINELFKEWDIVVFPILNVSKIIRKQSRVFDKATALRLSCISHYKLRRRCMDRAEVLEGKYVLEVGEPGTSRTCGGCGQWHDKLGGSRVFSCPCCSVEIDRDVNGARNNLLATF